MVPWPLSPPVVARGPVRVRVLAVSVCACVSVCVSVRACVHMCDLGVRLFVCLVGFSWSPPSSLRGTHHVVVGVLAGVLGSGRLPWLTAVSQMGPGSVAPAGCVSGGGVGGGAGDWKMPASVHPRGRHSHGHSGRDGPQWALHGGRGALRCAFSPAPSLPAWGRDVSPADPPQSGDGDQSRTAGSRLAPRLMSGA